MQAGRCVAAAAESCGALTSLIDVSSGTVTLRGSTAKSVQDSQLSCALPGSVGPDVVFGFTLAQRRRVTATVKPLSTSPGFQPIVGARTECATTSAEIACGYFAPERGQASFVAEAGEGQLFLWVDSETDVGGEFELEVTFDEAPSVDSCAAPGVLRGQDLIELTGDTHGLADDGASSCGGMGAPDAVYRLTLDRPRRIKIEALGLVGFRPVLSVRRTCTALNSEAACTLATPSTNVAVVEIPSAEAGDYFLAVDGASSGATGRYRLRVALAEPVPPPTNEFCSSASELITMSGMTSVSVQGDTTGAKSDAVGCDGTGPDLVYSLQLAQPSMVRVLVTPFAGSRLQPVLYLRRDQACTSQIVRDQLHCAPAGQAGFPAQLEVPRLETGRYYLFVDGKAGTSGAFDLQLELGPPPSPPGNDACSSASQVSLAGGPVFLGMETTVGALPDATTCADTADSPDVAYAFTLTSRQSLSIDARALAGSRLLPVVTLKPAGLCAVTSLLPVGRCAYSDLQVPDRAVAVVPSLDPGTYSLWVSGDLATQGPFSLRLLPGPPLTAPSNDACITSAMAYLQLGSNATGDTRAANDTTEGNCGFPLGANGEAGGDVAYSFQIAAPTPTVTITVTPDAVGGVLMRPVVYVRGGPQVTNCTSAGQNLGCQAAPDFGAPVSVTLTNVQPGTYTVWVDGAGLSAGSFSLAIH